MQVGQSRKTNYTLCPHCGYAANAVAGVNERVTPEPAPGDVSLCISCGNWAVIADDHTLRLPTYDETQEIETSKECRAAWHAWNLLMIKPPPQNMVKN
jgi:hypothetical protein